MSFDNNDFDIGDIGPISSEPTKEAKAFNCADCGKTIPKNRGQQAKRCRPCQAIRNKKSCDESYKRRVMREQRRAKA